MPIRSTITSTELAAPLQLGVTASFNRNVLNHVNRVLGSDFDPAAFVLQPAGTLGSLGRGTFIVRSRYWPGGNPSRSNVTPRAER